jgi:hypothetical protein
MIRELTRCVAFAVLAFVPSSVCGGTEQDSKPVAAKKPVKNTAIFVFPKVQVIDFAGPLEVFANAAAADHGSLDVFTVAAEEGPIETTAGLVIQPKHVIDDHPPIDVLVLPGGWGVAGRSATSKTASGAARSTSLLCPIARGPSTSRSPWSASSNRGGRERPEADGGPRLKFTTV